jgi:hypothetical protein
VIYTVLLGVSLVYWLFVIVGSVDVDLLGGGLEGAAKGALEGAAKGALEGSMKGALEGQAEAGLFSALKLRSAPVTVVLSLLFTFAWLFCVIGKQLLGGGWLTGSLVLLASTVLALPCAAIVSRPVGKLFATHPAKRHKELVGRVCVVSTGTVDKRHGQATLDDGGAGLILQVRVDEGKSVKRGDRVLIVGWDDEKEGFVVEPMEDIERIERRG